MYIKKYTHHLYVKPLLVFSCSLCSGFQSCFHPAYITAFWEQKRAMKRLAHQHQHSPLMEKRSQYHSYLVQIVPYKTISKAPLNQGLFMEKKHIWEGKMQNSFKPVTVNTTLTGSKSPIQMHLVKWHSKNGCLYQPRQLRASFSNNFTTTN